MYATIDAHLEDALVLSSRGRRGNLDTAGRVGFLGCRQSYVEFFERLFGGRAERRNPRKFYQVSQPVVVFIEEQLNRISIKTISLILLSHFPDPSAGVGN